MTGHQGVIQAVRDAWPREDDGEYDTYADDEVGEERSSVLVLNDNDLADASSEPPTEDGLELEPDQGVLRLCLMDGFALECDDSLVDLPLSAQRLLAFLAFHERPVLRPYVAGCLWSEKSEDRANANLRGALWRLRQPGLHLVEAVGNHLAIAPTLRIDIRETFVRARELLDNTSDPLDHPEWDELLLSGEILPDWYDDWVAIERERLRQLRLHALEALCSRLTERGKLAQAVDVGLAAVAAEPLRESVHRVLIRAYIAEGNKADAIRQYEVYCNLLWDELAVTPSHLLITLIDEVRSPVAGLRDETATHRQR